MLLGITIDCKCISLSLFQYLCVESCGRLVWYQRTVRILLLLWRQRLVRCTVVWIHRIQCLYGVRNLLNAIRSYVNMQCTSSPPHPHLLRQIISKKSNGSSLNILCACSSITRWAQFPFEQFECNTEHAIKKHQHLCLMQIFRRNSIKWTKYTHSFISPSWRIIIDSTAAYIACHPIIVYSMWMTCNRTLLNLTGSNKQKKKQHAHTHFRKQTHTLTHTMTHSHWCIESICYINLIN